MSNGDTATVIYDEIEVRAEDDRQDDLLRVTVYVTPLPFSHGIFNNPVVEEAVITLVSQLQGENWFLKTQPTTESPAPIGGLGVSGWGESPIDHANFRSGAIRTAQNILAYYAERAAEERKEMSRQDDASSTE